MKLLFDSQIFCLQRHGGISRYFCELLKGMNTFANVEARSVSIAHFNEYLSAIENFNIGRHIDMRIPRTGRLYRACNFFAEPLATRIYSPDIIHHTYYRPFKKVKGRIDIITVFDMIHELYPEIFPLSDSTSKNKRICVNLADKIICISQSAAADLINLFGVDPQKIIITYLSASKEFYRKSSSVQVDINRGRPYLLYVGQRVGYKNFFAALKAYSESELVSRNFDFVCFGGPPFNDKEKESFAHLKLRPDALKWLSGTDDELAQAYQNARAFIYPSLYEGFGIPPLEAMMSGCPVVCSNTSSIPEVVGDAALLFDPCNLQSIATALDSVCFNEDTRTRNIQRGFAQVQRFSWDRCVRETYITYSNAAQAGL